MTTAIQRYDDRPPRNPRELRFCEEYLKDFSAQGAALRAGYSRSFAEKRAFELTKKFANYLLVRQREIAQRTQAVTNATTEDVAREMACLAMANIGDYIEYDGPSDRYSFITLRALTREQKAAIKSVTIDPSGKLTYELHDKSVALERLARMFGMTNPKIQVDVRNQINAQQNVLNVDLSKVPTNVLQQAMRAIERAAAIDAEVAK